MPSRSRDHHVPCPGGCNMLADECECPPARRNPLGGMTITPPIWSKREARAWVEGNCQARS